MKNVQPGSSATSSNRPIDCRCFGVETDNAITSPIASWNPKKEKENQDY